MFPEKLKLTIPAERVIGASLNRDDPGHDPLGIPKNPLGEVAVPNIIAAAEYVGRAFAESWTELGDILEQPEFHPLADLCLGGCGDQADVVWKAFRRQADAFVGQVGQISQGGPIQSTRASGRPPAG